MARTKDPHRAALKSWESRRRIGPIASKGDWKKAHLRSGPRRFGPNSPSDAAIRKATNGKIGREEAADLAGALPGSSVSVSVNVAGDVTVDFWIHAPNGDPVGQATRTIVSRRAQIINVSSGLNPAYRGKGIGTAMFAKQVESAVRHGMRSSRTLLAALGRG